MLLIDEIDKTDQEFEAMLLELLSDFQISIPELGRIEARTQPVVLLTSNNTRELTEALKRRCLYLWLDYPELEHELEIVRLHSPDLHETVARKLVEIVGQIRELDLKKPPEHRRVDRLGAGAAAARRRRHRRGHVPPDDERDRQAPHRPRHGRRAGRGQAGGGRDARLSRRRAAPGAPAAAAVREDSRARGGGFDGQLLAFAEDLRSEGVAVGTSELLDAFAALEHVSWTSQPDFKEALAATLAKSPEDRRVFELVFDRFFFRAAEAEAARREITEGPPAGAAGELDVDLEELRRQIAAALRDGDEATLRDLARLAIAAFGRGEGSGVLGVDVQRIRRALGLRTEPQPTLPDDDPRRDGVPREQLRRFEQQLRRELERDLIERTQSLPPKRPLTELDRALPTGPIQDLAAVHRVVAQLKRRLATQGHELRGRKRHAHVDVRRTMRASLQTGGVPVELKYRPQRPRRPEIFVLCDVSTSVTSASTFFLSVLHALHDSFRKLRSFVFIERISEVTEVFERERDFRAAAEAVSRDAGVADVSGYTDYGRVWTEFLARSRTSCTRARP